MVRWRSSMLPKTTHHFCKSSLSLSMVDCSTAHFNLAGGTCQLQNELKAMVLQRPACCPRASTPRNSKMRFLEEGVTAAGPHTHAEKHAVKYPHIRAQCNCSIGSAFRSSYRTNSAWRDFKQEGNLKPTEASGRALNSGERLRPAS